MNNITLVGNLTRDPELKNTTNGTSVVSFSIAVNRILKREGKPDCDFFKVTVFGKTAEFVNNYVRKGNKVSVVGRVEIDSYEKDGIRIPTIDVIALQVNNLTPKQSTIQSNANIDRSDEAPF